MLRMRAFGPLRKSRSQRGSLPGTFWTVLLVCEVLNLIGTNAAFADDIGPTRQELDRIAYAVDGAESSHGTNPAMWRPNPAGPQGPMQVSDKAARDVGGGDRFDIAQNRAIGRAYLALLYRHYANSPDALSAYSCGAYLPRAVFVGARSGPVETALAASMAAMCPTCAAHPKASPAPFLGSERYPAWNRAGARWRG